jgi:hypothetical protein
MSATSTQTIGSYYQKKKLLDHNPRVTMFWPGLGSCLGEGPVGREEKASVMDISMCVECN